MKPYGFIVMLLIGLLVPMTIASSSIDFDVNTVLFDNQEIVITVDVLKSVQPLKTKSMITKEVAEGIRKRSYIGSKVDIYISAYPPLCTLWPIGKKEDQQYNYQKTSLRGTVRYQVDSFNGLEIDITEDISMSVHIYNSPGINQKLKRTNYIRADTDNMSPSNYNPLRGSDIQGFNKELLHYAVIG